MESLSVENSLQDISEQTFLELLHSCVDTLCGRASKLSYNNFKFCTNWNNEEFDMLSIAFTNLLKSIYGFPEPNEKIQEVFPNLASNHIQCIVDCLTVRRDDIRNLFLNKSHGITGPVVSDFDWKLKWVLGTSALSSLREPLLQVDFNVSENEGDKSHKIINVELNSQELKMLIAALEKAEEGVKFCVASK